MDHDRPTSPASASTIQLASEHLSDDEFLAQLQDGSLAPTLFRHADHLRLAWICLHRAPFDAAMSEVQATIRSYANAIGATGLYHETITTAWVHLVATHHESDFAEFLTRNAAQLASNPLKRFYSEQALSDTTASSQWTAPDLQPLPAH